MRGILVPAVLVVSLGGPVAGAAATPGVIPKPPGANPGNRGWEKVSPQDKNNADVYFHMSTIQASADGDRLAFKSSGAAGAPENATNYNSYLAQRGDGGWATKNLTSPQRNEVAGTQIGIRWGYNWFSSDLSNAIFMQGDPPLAADAPSGIRNLYLRDTQTGVNRVITPAPLSGLQAFVALLYEPKFAAATADGRRVLYQSDAQLTPDAPDQSSSFAPQPNVYEWVEGQTRLVAANAVAGRGLTVNVDTQASTSRAMSSDGSTIFFTRLPPGGPEGGGIGAPGQGEIFVVKNGVTTLVSASRRDVPDAAQPAQFLTATPDGSAAFFRSCERLTNDSTAAGASCQESGSKADLYRYDVAGGELTDLTAASGVSVVGLMDISDNGSYVYFAGVDDGLYLWHDGAVKQIAANLQTATNPAPFNWYDTPFRSSRVSADGRRLLFQGHLDASPGSVNDGIDKLYLYSADTDELTCVSCPADGSPVTGPATVTPLEEGNPGLLRQYMARAFDASGSHVFFEAGSALVSQDVNGKTDVYEYDIAKKQVSLISSGTADAAARFADVSADGSSVFFTTTAQLVAADQDGLRDVYVARAGGGQPEPEADGDATCDGDVCQGPPAPTPPPSLAGSMVFQSVGGAVDVPVRASRSVNVSKMKAVTGTAATLKVKVSGAGVITATGSSVRSVTRSASKPATYSVVVALSTKARATLKRKRTLAVKVTVRFKAAGGGSAAKDVTLTFKQPKTAKKKGGR